MALSRLSSKTYAAVAQFLMLVLYFAYFLSNVWGGIWAWFSADDLMNLHYYWSRPWSELLWANIKFFSDYYRPIGGLYYLSVFSIFGFDPVPFRIGALVFVSFNILLLYRIAHLLTQSAIGAFLCLILVGMHSSLFYLYFDTGMIYDVLAYTFYYSAFAYYIMLRSTQRVPGRGQSVLIFVLFILSIRAKEIAVTFPLAIGLYELIWFPPISWRPRAIFKWLFSAPMRIVLISGLLLMIYLLGMAMNSDSLLLHPAYRPHLSLGRYLDTYGNYLGQLFYRKEAIKPVIVAASLLIGVGFSFFTKQRVMIWAALFNIVSILPIAFIPARNGFAFYIPATGWAIFLSALVLYIGERFARGLSALIPVQQDRTRWFIQGLLAVGLACYLLPIHSRKLYLPIQYVKENSHFEDYWKNLREILPHPVPGARILIVNDPLGGNSYNIYFLTRLMYEDPSLLVHRVKQSPHVEPFEKHSDYDYVIDFIDNRFVLAESHPSSR